MKVKIRYLPQSSVTDETVNLNITRKWRISKMRRKIKEKLGIDLHRQRLYYRGKELVDSHSVLEYGMKEDDILQLMIRPNEEESTACENPESSDCEPKFVPATSRYYRVGDCIDYMDCLIGAWFEARIMEIMKEFPATKDCAETENSLMFKIKIERGEDTAAFSVGFQYIRPRSHHVYRFSHLHVGLKVLVNYNFESPNLRGFWYDCIITKITKTQIFGTLYLDVDGLESLEQCCIKFFKEIMRIEVLSEWTARVPVNWTDIPPRKILAYCSKCNDDLSQNCKFCGCKVCSKKSNASHLLLCDECDMAFHLSCLNPPLTEVPPDNWYCPSCKTDVHEIVKPGERLKVLSKVDDSSHKKREKKSSRRTDAMLPYLYHVEEPLKVAKDHCGPIPGIAVGMRWKYRAQLSESGIHRPLVGNVHVGESGVTSVILTDVSLRDPDLGEEFLYTLPCKKDGGDARNLDIDNICDVPRALRMSMKDSESPRSVDTNTDPDADRYGEVAPNWLKAQPVRVVRSFKQKNSKFAPKWGFRYDGVYKVVEYFHEKEENGKVIVKFLFRRDDPSPSPWLEEAPKFKIICPSLKTRKTRKGKEDPPFPKIHVQPYLLPQDIENTIWNDRANSAIWKDIDVMLKDGKESFLSKIEDQFLCSCCLEICRRPVTLECKHNFCEKCLIKSFRAQMNFCPKCRRRITVDGEFLVVNEHLEKILRFFFKKSK